MPKAVLRPKIAKTTSEGSAFLEFLHLLPLRRSFVPFAKGMEAFRKLAFCAGSHFTTKDPNSTFSRGQRSQTKGTWPRSGHGVRSGFPA
jgi:hypothetical protein